MAQERVVVDAGQFFEAIEDPLLNMLVPVIVQIAVDQMKFVTRGPGGPVNAKHMSAIYPILKRDVAPYRTLVFKTRF